MPLRALPLALVALLVLGCPTSEAARAPRGRQLKQSGDAPVCGAGAYFDLASSECKVCPIGSYQDKDKDAATQCEPCGVDKTTCCTGSTTSSACYALDSPISCPALCPSTSWTGPNGVATPFEAHTCPAGYFKEAGVNGCEACPAGTWMNRVNQEPACNACRAGTTSCCTKNTDDSSCQTIRFNRQGQVSSPRCSAQTCSVEPVWCPLGHFYDGSSCVACVQGTYNDNPTAESCSACGSDETTCCAGAITSSQCVKTAELFPAGDKCNYACPF